MDDGLVGPQPVPDLPEGFCGDGTCNNTSETCETCPIDCEACTTPTPDPLEVTCGNDLCDGTFEDCLTCPIDCGACALPTIPCLGCPVGVNELAGRCNPSAGNGHCGNRVCQRHACEDARTCPADCPAVCGDGVCTHAETHASCPHDCPAVCGDGACNGAETCETCSGDCGACRTCGGSTGLRCGDGICSPECGESWLNCSVDCSIRP